MQNSQLNRVIKLVKRTGDKTVIMDNESDAVMMLMDLGAYEKMLDHSQGVEKLTEEELLEKINRDVALWRAYNDKERVEAYDEVVEKPQDIKPPVYVPTAEDSKGVVSRNSEIPLAAGEKGKNINLDTTSDSPVTINKYPSIHAEQEQSAHDIVAEEDEEKFYLEPIE